MDDLLQLADDWSPIFKVLGDPTRLKLLLALHYRGQAAATVSELAEATGLKTATASAALKTMSATGIIAPEREGREVRYLLVNEHAHQLLHHVGGGHAH